MKKLKQVFLIVIVIISPLSALNCKDDYPTYELNISYLVEEGRRRSTDELSDYSDYSFINNGKREQLRQKAVKNADSLIIKFIDGLNLNSLMSNDVKRKAFEKFGELKPIGQSKSNIAIMKPNRKTDIDWDTIITYYEAFDEVKYAEIDYKARTCAYDGTNDPMYSVYQWNMRDMNLEQVWDFTYGSQDVKVAIIDSGIAYTDDPDTPEDLGCIPDLQGTNFINGYDYINDDEIAYDDLNHGTHLAGIIASTIDDGVGYVGIAPEVTLIPYKVVDKENNGNSSYVVEAIYDAVDKGADIINLGLTIEFETQALKEACSYAYDNDVLIFSATGNGSTYVIYPAVYDGVIGVGAVKSDKTVADYSNFGWTVDIVAYGGNYTDDNDDGNPDYIFQQSIGGYQSDGSIDYNFYDAGFTGTSQATAHATGVAALLKSYRPDASNRFIEAILENTAENLASQNVFDIYAGFGLINAPDSLSLLQTLSDAGITDCVNITQSHRNTFSQSISEKFNIDIAGGVIKIACGLYNSENSQVSIELIKDEVILESSDDGYLRYNAGEEGGEYTINININEL